MKIKDRAKPALPPVAPGTYFAVCVYSIDLGEQAGKDRNGQTYYSNKVRLGFELVGETVEIDGKTEPRILGRTFPVSRAKNSGLRKFVESWRGKVFSDDEFGDFDTNNLVGVPAQIGVILNDTGEYANINTVMQLPKGFAAPKATAPLIRYDMEPWSDAAFNALPEWAQEQIIRRRIRRKIRLISRRRDRRPRLPRPPPQRRPLPPRYQARPPPPPARYSRNPSISRTTRRIPPRKVPPPKARTCRFEIHTPCQFQRGQRVSGGGRGIAAND